MPAKALAKCVQNRLLLCAEKVESNPVQLSQSKRDATHDEIAEWYRRLDPPVEAAERFDIYLAAMSVLDADDPELLEQATKAVADRARDRPGPIDDVVETEAHERLVIYVEENGPPYIKGWLLRKHAGWKLTDAKRSQASKEKRQRKANALQFACDQQFLTGKERLDETDRMLAEFWSAMKLPRPEQRQDLMLIKGVRITNGAELGRILGYERWDVSRWRRRIEPRLDNAEQVIRHQLPIDVYHTVAARIYAGMSRMAIGERLRIPESVVRGHLNYAAKSINAAMK